jgi:hypothetical protein
MEGTWHGAELGRFAMRESRFNLPSSFYMSVSGPWAYRGLAKRVLSPRMPMVHAYIPSGWNHSSSMGFSRPG